MTRSLIALVFLFTAFPYVQAQTYSVDIPNAVNLSIGQRQSNWCWAACNQMLLNAAGIDEPQENQVVKLYGQLINQGAGPDYSRAWQALRGEYVSGNGQLRIIPYVSYITQRRRDDPVVIINHLSQGIPLVMATPAHGRVCVGVDYWTDGSAYQITSLRLLDPAYPGAVHTVTMKQFLDQGLIGFMTYDIE